MGTDTIAAVRSVAESLKSRKGRPLRGRMVSARVTGDELKVLEETAQINGMLLAEWARGVLLREARASRADALFTEIVAMRMMLNSLLRPLSCGETITPDEFTAQMMSIRTTKQKVAQEILQQYAPQTVKEQ